MFIPTLAQLNKWSKTIAWLLQKPFWRTILVFGFIALLPLLSSDLYYLGLGIQILIFAILALSSNLILGYGAQASFAHHAFFAIGAYVSATATLKLGITPLVSILLGMVVAGLIGIPVGFPAVRLRGFFLAVVTLAFAQIWHTFLIEFPSITGGPSGIPAIPRPVLMDFTFRSHQSYFYLVLFVTTALFLFVQNLLNSRYGRALQAMGMSETGAESFGVPVLWMKLSVFALSSAFMGLAGGLLAHFVRFVGPESFLILQTIIIVTMSVVGGMRSVWGALAGSIIMTLLPQAFRTYGDWQFFIYGAVLMIVLIILPKGLIPAISYWWRFGTFPLHLPRSPLILRFLSSLTGLLRLRRKPTRQSGG